MNEAHAAAVTLTLRLRVKREAYPWLNAAATEVNQVWNAVNERASSVLGNLGKWVSGFDLVNYTSGTTKYMDRMLYKGEHAGRSVRVVSERYTTQACSACGSLSGPRGPDMRGVREWRCRDCGVSHDRDVNAARNILALSGRGDRPPSAGTGRRAQAPPSQASCRCEAGIGAQGAAA